MSLFELLHSFLIQLLPRCDFTFCSNHSCEQVGALGLYFSVFPVILVSGSVHLRYRGNQENSFFVVVVIAAMQRSQMFKRKLRRHCRFTPKVKCFSTMPV